MRRKKFITARQDVDEDLDELDILGQDDDGDADNACLDGRGRPSKKKAKSRVGGRGDGNVASSRYWDTCKATDKDNSGGGGGDDNDGDYGDNGGGDGADGYRDSRRPCRSGGMAKQRQLGQQHQQSVGAYTSISKLAIQGIRAFSPHREQTIQFFKPLTMIVGANGCGKTTIIECLKYICTGTPPPGGDKGKSFVHDPKIAGVAEVKGSIKLRFCNRAGQDMVVIRSLQVTQKKTTATFKTLDGVIKATDPETGAKTAMSHKCGELDKQVPYLMGVSKAIMENVIFCHQEESSWPLADPAALKKKFDDIFESSRYSKALSTIRKAKQEYHSKSKDLKAELASLEAYEAQANEIQRDLTKTQGNMERYQAREEKFNLELSEVEVQLDAHRNAMKKVQAKKGEHTLKEQDIQLKKVMLDSRREGFNVDDDATEMELRDRLKSMRSDDASKNAALEKVLQKKESAESRLSNCQEELNTKNTEIGKLQAEVARHAEDVKARGAFAKRLAGTYDLGAELPFPASDDAADPGDSDYLKGVKAFTATIEAAVDNLQVKLMKAASEHECTLQEARHAHSEAQGRLLERETKLKQLDGEYDHADDELQVANRDITEMGRHRSQLRNLEDTRIKAATARADAAQYKGNPEFANLASKLKAAEKHKRDLELEIDDLRSVQELAQSREDDDKRYSIQEAEIQNSLAELDIQLDQNRKLFLAALEGTAPTLQRDSLEKANAALKEKVATVADALATANRRNLEVEREVVKKETQRQGLVPQKKDTVEKIEELTNGGDDGGLDGRRKHLVQRVEDAREDEDVCGEEHEAVPKFTMGTAVGIIVEFAERDYDLVVTQKAGQEAATQYLGNVLKKAQGKMDKGKAPKCDCCKREMKEEEFRVFEKAIRSKLDSADRDLTEAINVRKETVALAKMVQRELLEREALRDTSAALEARMRGLEREAAALRVDRDEASAAAEKAGSDRDELRVVEAELGKLLQEFANLSQRQNDIEERRQRLMTQADPFSASQKLPNTLCGINLELRDKTEEKEKVAEEVMSIKDGQIKMMRRASELDAQARTWTEDQDKLEGQAKKMQHLEERRDALRATLARLDTGRGVLRKEIAPLQSRLKESHATMDRMSQNWKQQEARLRTDLQAATRDVNELHRLNEVVTAALKRGTNEALQKNDDRVAELISRIENYTVKVEGYRDEITRVEQEVAELETMKSTVVCSLDCLRYKREISSMEDELKCLLESIQAAEKELKGCTGGVTESMTFSQCEKKKLDLEMAKSENKGKMDTTARQLKETQDRLKGEKLKSIKERTRQQRVILETTNMAVEDLEKYWTALDKALLRYHGQKIGDINRIIRELWQRTYMGEDIESIEIVSGEENSSSRASRSYNYRVAMRKGDVTVDMRGRCSAGQRVLACIVIRLALAETFCLSCGILTLDEPTTNLDEYNKTGLATALADIISSRAKQKNFQLLVITHDADFVTHMRDAFNSLGTDRRFNLPEYYWRITRNQTGQQGQYCSEINRTDWDDM